jgi:hypothetical protein
MDYSQILAALRQASAFDLFRLRAAIDRTLDQPDWMLAVQSRLQVGQAVTYFDPPTNRAHVGPLLELRRKQAVVLDQETRRRWLISYAAINLDNADIEVREQPRQGLGRNEVAVGDTVGFVDREQKERSGQVVRLNDKTVTLMCNGQQWRVSYALLHRIVDGSRSADTAGVLPSVKGNG